MELLDPKIYEQINLPDGSLPTDSIESRFIYSFLKETGFTKTLEIGFAYGVSTAHIMSATQSPHYVIDPFQMINYGGAGVINIEKLGLGHNLNFIENHSCYALPELIQNTESLFEFIFIDGSHLYDDVMIDFYYANMLLGINGFILFDDTVMKPIKYVINWIKTNRKDYRVLQLPKDPEGEDSLSNFSLVQKISEDNREWDHFVDHSYGKTLWLDQLN